MLSFTFGAEYILVIGHATVNFDYTALAMLASKKERYLF